MLEVSKRTKTFGSESNQVQVLKGVEVSIRK